MTVSLIDYGLGNVGSVANMLRRNGASVAVISDPRDVAQSERLLLPGVGAFDLGVRRLQETGFFTAIQDFAGTGRPLLGICLGMQLLGESSAEGEAGGLGLIAGRSERLPVGEGVRIPHMGWNLVAPVRDDPLTDGLPAESRFYFVHSYHLVLREPEYALARTSYGTDFVSMVRRENVWGAQFHPEKSHDFGRTILRNFATL